MNPRAFNLTPIYLSNYGKNYYLIASELKKIAKAFKFKRKNYNEITINDAESI